MLKNKLEKEVNEYLITKNRLVVEAKEIGKFKYEILHHIDYLTIKHIKCKKINASFEPSYSNQGDDFIFRGIYAITFIIYKSKN